MSTAQATTAQATIAQALHTLVVFNFTKEQLLLGNRIADRLMGMAIGHPRFYSSVAGMTACGPGTFQVEPLRYYRR